MCNLHINSLHCLTSAILPCTIAILWNVCYNSIRFVVMQVMFRPHVIPQLALEYMETMEIRCPKSMLNVAERAKKSKNRYISGFSERSGRRGRRFKSCHPDHQITLTLIKSWGYFLEKYKFLLYNNRRYNK